MSDCLKSKTNFYKKAYRPLQGEKNNLKRKLYYRKRLPFEFSSETGVSTGGMRGVEGAEKLLSFS